MKVWPRIEYALKPDTFFFYPQNKKFWDLSNVYISKLFQMFEIIEAIKEEAICTLSVSMCAKIIINTLMCAEIIIHTLNVCENNYSHNECVNIHFCRHSMCVEIIIHTLGVVWFCRQPLQ